MENLKNKAIECLLTDREEIEEYFEMDPDQTDELSRMEEPRLFLTVYPFQKRAEYILCESKDNSANFPSVEDDYEGVMEFLQAYTRKIDKEK